jgi:RNA polymerase sigma factor (sigma-70 family)
MVRTIERRAGTLLRYETAEDLWQGVCVLALKAEQGFTYQGREPFFAWLHTVTQHHLSARRRHWHALKRRPAGLFRLTEGPSTDPRARPSPAAEGTGPVTFAARREQLNLAVRALDCLLDRDQKLVRWASQGISTAEQAERLGVTPATAERARQRAVERYRKAYRILERNA